MLGSAEGQSEAAGLVARPEETQDTILELNPAHGDPAPNCYAAGMGGGVGAVDGPQGAAAWETGLVTGVGVSGRGLGDGDLGALQDRAPALGEVAGYRVGSPEGEPGDGSSHPGGLAKGRGESAGGGGGDGGHWGGDGGGCCCCCCSGGGCCGRGGGGGSVGLFDHAGVSLEGCACCGEACGISLACKWGVVCDWEAAPRGEWERKE